MSKILLVDTNFSSFPIYKEMLDLGHEVHVVGSNPKDCLAKLSPNYWQINYADIELLQELVDKEKFDYLIPGCTDRSYETCTLLNGRSWPGIDRPESNQTINNKSLFKKWAERVGLPVAKSQKNIFSSLRWPLIVKPVDAFSGKGITVLHMPDQNALSSAISDAQNASTRGEYLIEDYIEGQLYSHTAFLHNHKIIQDFIVREDRTVNPFVVDTSCVIHKFCEKILNQIRECIEKISKELQLVDGLIHTQFVKQDNRVWLIELTRRCPGDLYSQLIELSTGFKYAKNYALPFLGKKAEAEPTLAQPVHIMRHTVTVDEVTTLEHLHFKRPVWIERWIALSLVGDTLNPSPASRAGILFCKTEDEKELKHLYDLTLSRELYEVRK